MIKTYRMRLYPTKEQEGLMGQHIGACRYVWNWMLTKQQELYAQGEKHLSAFSMIKLLTPLKKDGEHGWLYDVSNTSCQIICQDLDKAYKEFFAKRRGFPKFKSRKKSKSSFPVCNEKLRIISDTVMQIQKLGRVKCRIDNRLNTDATYKFSNARITYKNGKWIMTVGIESESQVPELTDKSMGIDLGVKDSAIVAFGSEKVVFPNINKGRQIRLLKKFIKHLQRSVSRKYEANKTGKKYTKTKNIERCEERLRKLHERLSNIRTNYIHQSTNKLIKLLPRRVVMEDLNVKGMMKNKHLSKAVQEQCLSEWIRQMEYKCAWNGIEFIQADRFYPSSKTCSNCGCIKHDLKLSDRTFVCNECGFTIDRDYQAALNLMRYEG